MLKPIDKQTARTWYQYLAEPFVAKMTGRVLRATGPRIAVVGNCQSFSVAYSMQLLCPTAKVDHFPVIIVLSLTAKIPRPNSRDLRSRADARIFAGAYSRRRLR